MRDDVDAPSDRVSTRCVVQISGFDPRGASFYHGLFSREAAKHAEKHGIDIQIGRRRRRENHWHEWTTHTNHAEHATSVNIRFLGWDDIIRSHWIRSRPALFWKSCVTYFVFLKTGGLYRCFRMTWYPMVALLFPALGLIALYLILMLSLGAAFFALAMIILGLTGLKAALAGGIGALTGAGSAHFISPHLKGGWLLRIFCFCRLLSEKPLPELEERLDGQAADLLAFLIKEQPDELLVVAHSVGSLVAFPLLDRVLESESWQGRVSLLTLGECIPLTSFLQPEEDTFNTCLRRVALHPRLDWIDFSMPSDGACFALLDPVRATFNQSIIYPQPDLPKFLSARFMEGYSNERYIEFKRNRYLFHFLYFMSPDRPAGFDYLAITLGDQRLAERFRNRKNQARN